MMAPSAAPASPRVPPDVVVEVGSADAAQADDAHWLQASCCCAHTCSPALGGVQCAAPHCSHLVFAVVCDVSACLSACMVPLTRDHRRFAALLAGCLAPQLPAPDPRPQLPAGSQPPAAGQLPLTTARPPGAAGSAAAGAGHGHIPVGHGPASFRPGGSSCCPAAAGLIHSCAQHACCPLCRSRHCRRRHCRSRGCRSGRSSRCRSQHAGSRRRGAAAAAGNGPGHPPGLGAGQRGLQRRGSSSCSGAASSAARCAALAPGSCWWLPAAASYMVACRRRCQHQRARGHQERRRQPAG